MESPRFCIECGASVKPSAKFCASCGKPVLPESSTMENDQEDLVSNHEAVVERSSTSTTTETNSKSPISTKSNTLAKGVFASGIFFFLAYLFVSIPTYVFPYFGSNSSVLNSIGTAVGTGAPPLVWFHLLTLYLLVAIAWLRGGLVGRQWLAVFPVFAAIFDIVPGFNVIPLIPTIFHILAIVLGLSGKLVSEEIAGSEKSRLLVASIGFVALIAFAFYKVQTFNNQISSNSITRQSAPSAVQRNNTVSQPTISKPIAVTTPPPSDFKIYPAGTYTFNLKAGQTTGQIDIPIGNPYNFTSDDLKFKVVYSDGKVVNVWKEPLPSKHARFSITAVTDQVIIMKVLQSK